LKLLAGVRIAKRADGAVVYSVNHSVSDQRIPEHHAEARVLRKCDFGSILYVARVYKDRITVVMLLESSVDL
jgi:hypothetical protein